MTTRDPLRQHLSRLLDWHDAHATYDAAVADLPPEHRGTAPAGLPYSPWQLIEHIRLAQADILAFCTKPDYEEGTWPDDYWPATSSPPDGQAWDASIAAYHQDLEALRTLVGNEKIDPFAEVPVGTGQTLLREYLLVADHTAYHVGELIVLRRLLGDWPAA